jgi:hypothetical protein
MELKPGQLCTISNTVFRAKRKTAGCEGCFFSGSFFTCPGILDQRKMTRKVDCVVHNIILVRV